MNHKIVLALFIMFSINLFSQESKLSVELSYPIPADQNFVGKNYNGLIDTGLKYRFIKLSNVAIGGSLNGSIIKNSKKDAVQPFDVTAFFIQPRLFAELNSETISKFHPSVGLGYTFMIFNASGIKTFNPEDPGVKTSSSSETESGFNFNLGLAYDVTNKFFAIVQYDFIKLSITDEVPSTKYNININIFKIGVGYRL